MANSAVQRTVGNQPTQIWGASSQQGNVQVINNDATHTAYLGNGSNIVPSAPYVPLGPGDSLTFDGTQPVYAVASVQLSVSVIPGGSSYSPGTLAISGPVTATISGTVDVDVQNTSLDVNVSNSSLDVSVTNSVLDVAVTGTANVAITGTPAVTISGTPAVTISGTPTVDVGTVSGSIDINTVAGNVNVNGVGGYIAPGDTAQVYQTTSQSIAAASSFSTPVKDMLNYQGYDLQFSAWTDGGGVSGSAIVAQLQLNWYADSGGTYLLYTETYWTWLATTTSSFISPAVGSGPCHARYFSITVQNIADPGSIHVTNLTIFGSARTFSVPQWRQAAPIHGGISSDGISYASWLNPTASVLPGFDGVLINQYSVTPSGSGSFWIPLPLFTGTVSCYYDTSTAFTQGLNLCTAQALISGVVVSGTSGSPVIWNPGNASGTAYTATLNLPNAPCYITGNATTSATFTITIMGNPN